MSIDDYLESLIRQLKILKPHDFINKQQSSYFKELKETLGNKEILVICDFFENYAFVVQNAARVFHYNNNQATIYTVIYYYRKEKELKRGNVIIISESTTHDATAVHICNSMVIEHLKKHHKFNKTIFFSDGAKQHFKNRYNIHNVLNYEKDFGTKGELLCDCSR